MGKLHRVLQERRDLLEPSTQDATEEQRRRTDPHRSPLLPHVSMQVQTVAVAQCNEDHAASRVWQGNLASGRGQRQSCVARLDAPTRPSNFSSSITTQRVEGTRDHPPSRRRPATHNSAPGATNGKKDT